MAMHEAYIKACAAFESGAGRDRKKLSPKPVAKRQQKP
jgi:hypothetical protein